MSDPPVLGDPSKELPADYAALHVEVLKRLHTVLALPAHLWEKRSDEAGVSIALHTPANSPHVMVRSEVTIRMPPERVFSFYMLDKNMHRWAPDAQLREVVRISPAAAVVHAAYPLPAPLDARDVVMYRVSLSGEATRLAGCVRAAVAVSIDHNLVGPPPKGTVRAELIISATCFNVVPGQPSCTRVVSYQHVDPRGRLPPALVNRGVGAGTSSLRAVRDDLDALTAMEARMAKAQKK